MKISMIRPLIIIAALLSVSAAQLTAADVTYSNLTVTGTAEFGTWSSGDSGPGMILNYADGATAAVNFIGSGSATVWQWWNYNGSANSLSMALDQTNRLILYSGTLANIALNPSGTSSIAGSLTIGGTNNTLPNQILLGGNSILTEGLADGRYLTPATANGLYIQSGSTLAVSSGKLGIGNTNPQAPLDVSGTSTNNVIGNFTSGGSVAGLAINAASSGGKAVTRYNTQADVWQVGAVNDGSVQSSTNGFIIYDTNANAVRLAIDGTGNVGIDNPNPHYTLDVQGTLNVKNSSGSYLRMAGSDNSWLNFSSAVGDANFVVQGNGGHQWIVSGGQDYYWGGGFQIFDQTVNLSRLAIDTSGNVSIGANPIQGPPPVYVASSGSVGIGTQQPQALLDVQGNGNFTGPVRLAPQGDLDMGAFTYDPTQQNQENDSLIGGGGGTMFHAGAGGSRGGVSGTATVTGSGTTGVPAY